MTVNVADNNISFVIPVLNGERFLRRCLEQILLQYQPGDELVVVDNGSTDRTVAIAKSFPEVRMEIRPGLSVAGLRNVGARGTTGSLLAFIDSDCLLLSGWREAVMETMRDDRVVATGSLPEISEQPTWVERAWGSLKYRKALEVRYIPAMNFVMRRTTFDSVNGFDDQLRTDEDTDICTRVLTHGGLIIENPQVGAIHLGNPKTLRAFTSKERWHASSIMLTMKRHGVDRPMAMTFAFIGCIGLSLALFILGILGKLGIGWGIVPLFVVPLVTAVYRVAQYRNYGAFLPLIVLYSLFYLVRSEVIFRSIGPGKGRADDE